MKNQFKKWCKVERCRFFPHCFPSFTKLPLWGSQSWSTYFLIEIALWKMENNEEAMCMVPLCSLFYWHFCTLVTSIFYVTIQAVVTHHMWAYSKNIIRNLFRHLLNYLIVHRTSAWIFPVTFVIYYCNYLNPKIQS